MSRDLLLVAISMFTWGVGEGLFLYFQPLYLQQLGARPLLIGALYSAVGIFMALSQAPAGYLSDRWGRRQLMWLSWISGTAATWVMALAGTLESYAAGMLLYGLTGFVMAPLNSYTTAARGKWSIAAAVTLVSGSYSFGAVIGPIVGGQLGTLYGLQAVYHVSGVIFLISTALILIVRSQPVEKRHSEESHINLTRNRSYLIFLAVVFLSMLAMYLPQPLTPNFLQNQRGLSLETIGQFGTIGNLGNALLTLGLGRLNPALGLLLGQVSIGLYAALIWRSSNIYWLGVGLFFVGGYRAARAMVVSMARPLVHGAQMGLAYGLIETANAVAIILAPMLAGIAYSYNPSWVYPLSLVLIAVSLVVSTFYSLGSRRRALANQSGAAVHNSPN